MEPRDIKMSSPEVSIPQNTPPELLSHDVPEGKYRVVFKNGVTEYWVKDSANGAARYTLMEGWDNGCDGVSFEDLKMVSQGRLKDYQLFKIERDHPTQKELSFADIPLIEWGEYHDWLQENCPVAFTKGPGVHDYFGIKFQVEMLETPDGPRRRITKIDN